jgi:hypothetical protein
VGFLFVLLFCLLISSSSNKEREARKFMERKSMENIWKEKAWKIYEKGGKI